MSLFLRAVLDKINQLSSPNYVNSRGHCLGMSHHGLLFKFFYSAGFIHTDCTESGRILARFQFLAHYGNICLFRNMIFKYLIIIQLVHRIAGSNDYIRLMTFPEKIKILVDRVRGSPVPVTVVCCYGRCKHEQTALLSSEIPPF